MHTLGSGCLCLKSKKPLTGIDIVKAQIEETLPYVQLNSESAKREVLKVAPVLTRGCNYLPSNIEV